MTNRFFYQAKVVNVVDGDTLDLLVDLGFNVHHNIRVRLHGINTPESKTTDIKEKELTALVGKRITLRGKIRIESFANRPIVVIEKRSNIQEVN